MIENNNNGKIIIQPGDEEWGKPEGVVEEEDPKLAQRVAELKRQAEEERRKLTKQLLAHKQAGFTGDNFTGVKNRNPNQSVVGGNQGDNHGTRNQNSVPGKIITNITSGTHPLVKPNGNNTEEEKPTIYTAGGVKKETSRIMFPGEYTPTGRIITEVAPNSLPDNYQVTEQYHGNKKLENFSKENAEIIIGSFLKNLTNKYKIKNFLTIGKIKALLIEDGKVNIGSDGFRFHLTVEQREAFLDDILNFLKQPKNNFKENIYLYTEFWQDIFLIQKYVFLEDNKKLFNLDFLDETIVFLERDAVNTTSSANLQAIIKSNIDDLTENQVRKVLGILHRNNNLDNDLFLLLKAHHPKVWQQFSQSEEFLLKQQQLKKIAEELVEEKTIKEIVEKGYTYGRQLKGLILPEYQAKSNIGLELEFLKTGRVASFEEGEYFLKEIIEKSPFAEGRLYDDGDQTEVTFPTGGLKYDQELFTQLARFGQQLEINPYFVSYGSLHLNLDKAGKKEGQLFKFNKDNKNRLELLHHGKGPVINSRYTHLLNFSTTEKQFKIIDSLYNRYGIEEVRQFLNLKKEELNQKEFHQIFQDLGKLNLELLLSLAKKENNSDLLNIILTTYQEGALPMTMILDLLPEVLANIPGTKDTILALAELAKVSGPAAERLAEKFENIPGTKDTILGLAELAKVSWSAAERLAEKFENIPGTKDTILGLTELAKVSWPAAKELAGKFEKKQAEQIFKNEIWEDENIFLVDKFLILYSFDFDFIILGTKDTILALAELAKVSGSAAERLAERFEIADIEGNRKAIDKILDEDLKKILLSSI